MRKTESSNPQVVTKAGTVLARWKPAGVGKLIGGKLYVHRNYMHLVAPHLSAELVPIFGLGHAFVTGLGMPYACVRFDLLAHRIMFAESPDFDTAAEPHVGRIVLVDAGYTTLGRSNAIWHHKWLWVQDDYKGFDVAESIAWSRKYLSRLTTPPKGTDRAWKAQLKEIGL